MNGIGAALIQGGTVACLLQILPLGNTLSITSADADMYPRYDWRISRSRSTARSACSSPMWARKIASKLVCSLGTLFLDVPGAGSSSKAQ